MPTLQDNRRYQAMTVGEADALFLRTPDKDAALRRIMGGESIPGAEVVPPGDVAKIAFKKGYAEQLEG